MKPQNISLPNYSIDDSNACAQKIEELKKLKTKYGNLKNSYVKLLQILLFFLINFVFYIIL